MMSAACEQAKKPQPRPAAVDGGGGGDDDVILPRGIHGWGRWLFKRSTAFAELRRVLDANAESEAVASHDKTSNDFLRSTLQDRTAAERFHTEKMQRYAEWARSSLPVKAPDVFLRHAGSAATAPRFLDLGAAPGGLSAFLHGDLRWSGVAVSLAVEQGGMPVMYRGTSAAAAVARAGPRPASSIKSPFLGKLLGNKKKPSEQASTGAAFGVRDGDIRSVESMDACFCSSFPPSADCVTPGSCHFGMAGAVQDVSQRSTTGADADKNNEQLFAEQLSGRVEFVTCQLRTLHRALVPDGKATLMVVMGPAECASVVVVAQALESISSRVRVLVTMHANKSPIYLLATGVKTRASDDADDATRRVIDEAWRVLLDSGEIVKRAQGINYAVERGAATPGVAGWDVEVGSGLLSAGLWEDLDEAFAARRARLESQWRIAHARHEPAKKD